MNGGIVQLAIVFKRNLETTLEVFRLVIVLSCLSRVTHICAQKVPLMESQSHTQFIIYTMLVLLIDTSFVLRTGI